MTYDTFVSTNVSYNTFMEPNMTIPKVAEEIAATLQVFGAPARMAILIAIGRGEACVCHLEAVLGWRQAYISQHLMALRKAEILQDRRDGRYIYYQLKDESVLALVRDAAALSGLAHQDIEALGNPAASAGCECPHCAAVLIPVERIEKR